MKAAEAFEMFKVYEQLRIYLNDELMPKLVECVSTYPLSLENYTTLRHEYDHYLSHQHALATALIEAGVTVGLDKPSERDNALAKLPPIPETPTPTFYVDQFKNKR